jgi:hypothetical protein
MALEKRKILSKIEVESNGIIFVKELNEILDDGVVVSSIPHRTSYTPNMEIKDLPDEVKPYAAISWTPEVKSAYARLQESAKK